MSNSHLHVINHPFVIDSLTHLRDKTTPIFKFRHHSNQLCRLLFGEAIRGLDFKQCQIETPLAKIKSPKLKDEIIIVPILRSGLAMLYSAIDLLPKSKIGFVGLERNEKTAIANKYYWKLPKITKNNIVIITDPMLATGGSVKYVLDQISPQKPKEIRIVTVISAPEGIKLIHRKYPKIHIYTASLDKKLNTQKYIVPGLGDYGDRYFGTE